jgi:hypothetical protein
VVDTAPDIATTIRVVEVFSSELPCVTHDSKASATRTTPPPLQVLTQSYR